MSDRDTRKVNMQIKFDLSKEEFDASAIIAKSEETKSTLESTCGFVECKTTGNYRPISFRIKKNCKCGPVMLRVLTTLRWTSAQMRIIIR